MSRAAFALACALLSLGLTVGALTASRPATASHCPLAPSPTAPAPQVVGCYYPAVSVSANPSSVTVNSGTSTISYTITGANPSVGCVKTGGWSGSIPVNASGNASGQGVVGPFSTTGTINFNVSCPADPVNGFAGATVTINPSGPPPPPPPPSGCTENNTSQLYSEFVGMTTVPQTLNQGQTFTVSMTFKNTGQCTWTAANGYKLGSQNPENNTNWGTNRVLLGSSDAIAPGQSKTFVLNGRAPSAAGTYGFQWRMVREGINWFGPATLNATVNVDSSIEQYAISNVYGASASDVESFAAYRQAGSTWCRKIRPWVSWSQVFTGLLFWKYRQDVEWCWNNNRIVSILRTRYAEVNGFPGNPWSFQGHQGSNCNQENCSDRASGTSQLISTQGHFKACALFIVFCNDKHPQLEVRIFRGGGFTLVKATP